MNGPFYVGDIHLSPRRIDAYRWEIFPWLRKQCERRNVHDVVFLGDVADRKDEHPAPFVNQLVDSLFSLNATIWWLAGNHDYRDPTVPFFRFLDGVENVHFIYEPTEATINGNHHLFLPHTRDTTEWDEIDLGQYDTICMHQSVLGAIASNGQKMNGMRISRFDGIRARVISGDIHVPQKLGPVIYAGSPHPVHIGDAHRWRVLLASRDRLLSIPRHHLKKLRITIEDPEDLEAALEENNLEPPDHVAVTLLILPGQTHEVAQHRRKIRTELIRLGYVVHGVKVEVKQTRATLRKHTLIPQRRTPKGDIKAFIKHAYPDQPDPWKEYALGIASEIATEAQAPGDVHLRKLTISGYRSFTKPQTLYFHSRKPGLYLVTGNNEVDPQMTTNAVGKSSTFSAPTWCFFDKDPRGLRGPSLHNWERKDSCFVDTEFQKHRLTHTLRRMHDPNLLAWIDAAGEEHATTQDVVDDTIGTTYEHFLCTVLQGQFGTMFFDLTEGQQQATLAAALHLDIWTAASKRAAAEHKDLLKRSTDLRDEINGLTGRIQELKLQRKRFTEEVEHAEKSLRARVEELAATLQEVKRQIRQAMRHIRQANKDIQDAKSQLMKLRKYAATVDEDIRSTRKEIRVAEDVMRHAQHALQTIEDDATILDRQRCDRCLQEISESQRSSLEMSINASRDQNNFDLETAREEHERLQHALDVLLQQRDEVEQDVRDTERMMERRRMERERTTSDRQRLEARRDAIQADMESTDRYVDSLHTSLFSCKARLKSISADRRQKRAERRALEEHRSIVISWREAFKEARLFFLDQASWELEIEVNNAIQELGLPGWEVRFVTEREGSRGKAVRGFAIEVRSPTSVGWIPWKAWCGGETQRLRIAGAIGLAKLIEARTCIKWNVEFWDEPTQHLDQSGIEDLLAFFRQRAHAEQRQIWIADHHSIGLSGFDGHVVVHKTKSGTRFEANARLNDGE